MAQFSVYKNPNGKTQGAYPYLLDIQNDLLDNLATRVVVPLTPATAMEGKAIKTLMPLVNVEGNPYVMLTPQLAGISSRQLGGLAADLSHEREAIIAALDLLITGF